MNAPLFAAVCSRAISRRITPIAIYDFDSTIFSQDVDSVALELHSELIGPLRSRDYPGWNDFMNACVGNLHKAGVTPEQLQERFRRFSLNPGMEAMIRAYAAAGIPQFILSDANTLFIAAVLAQFGLKRFFPDEHIFTNPTRVDEHGRIHISYHHKNIWTSSSPINMCKGVAIHNIWTLIEAGTLPKPFPRGPLPGEDAGAESFDMRAAGRQWPVATSLAAAGSPNAYCGRTAYFGDGSNDFIACAQMRETDWACARRDYALHEHIATHDVVKFTNQTDPVAGDMPWPLPGKDSITAQVRLWSGEHPNDLRSIAEEIVRSNAEACGAAATDASAEVWWNGVAPAGSAAAAVAAIGSRVVIDAAAAAAVAAGAQVLADPAREAVAVAQV